VQPVECPGSVGQTKRLRVGQGGGQDLGDLLRRVGRRPPRTGHVVQAGGTLEVEPLDPTVDRGPGDTEFARGDGDLHPIGQCDNDRGPLDGAGLGNAGAGQRLDGLPLLGR
jgi:hypothetical protein